MKLFQETKASIVKAISGVSLLAMMASCGTKTNSRIDFNANDMTYDIDPKTGICFSATGTKTKWATHNNGMIGGCVPCTEEVLKHVSKSHLKQMEKDSIKPVNFVLTPTK